MLKLFRSISIILLGVLLLDSCDEPVEHTAPAIYPRDSVALMTSYGVNALISDSGVVKYRIVTERWELNPNRNPSRSVFDKGIFLTQFDEKFHVQSYIQCDTAYNYDKLRLWELRGRVRILTKRGVHFSSEQLFWNENKHELYSYVYSKIVTPERTLEGTYFRSDERMTHYYISNSKGSFEKNDFTGEEDSNSDSNSSFTPSRPQSQPQRRSN
ncbi:MAG: LPS export ABC transporter periplasmic protein LptC [Prevotella sp.]|nr:LPS export ABC transporter periplasmic protein LptC [Prevotella sp.]